MIVICEECGKKYRIDPSKIRGAAARFKCRVCAHMIMVAKQPTTSPAKTPVEAPASEKITASTKQEIPAAEPEIKLDRTGAEHVAPARKTRQTGRGSRE